MVFVGVIEFVGVFVGVLVGVVVSDLVTFGDSNGVLVLVGVIVLVGVKVGVIVDVVVLVGVVVGVTVFVDVLVGVIVLVDVLVGVTVGVGVFVGVMVGVGVGDSVGHSVVPYNSKLQSSQLSNTLYDSNKNVVFGIPLETIVQALNPSSVDSKNVFWGLLINIFNKLGWSLISIK